MNARACFVGILVVSVAMAVMGCDCSDDPAPVSTDGGRDSGVRPDGSVAAVCGDNAVSEDEACDDGNTAGGDGCSADCQSDESCGNGIIDTAADEVCDDSNTVNGDGCSSDCRSNETCGNGTVDIGVGEVCDDGNTMDGDGCSADCHMGATCGDGTQEGTEVCDDGNTTAGDGCSADCLSDETCGNGTTDTAAGESCDDGNTTAGDGCSATCTSEACGNGVVDGTEQCDDMNGVDGDGCDNDCTFSCAGTTDCDDAMACNGAETCDTTTHRCTNPPDLADGTSCGAGMVCRAGACTTTSCGNGIREGAEQCDDGNMTNGDGCDNDCTFSCAAAADCADTNVCNGAETCNTTTHVCAAGTAAADGTACDADAMPATRDICLMAICRATRCGDGYLDTMRMPAEQCDDGNTVSGDGCNADCTLPGVTPPTAFRVTALSLRDPHIYASVFGFCTDVTGTANSELMNAVTNYTLNFIAVFRPLDIAMPATPMDIVSGTCMAGTPLATCSVGTMGTVVNSNANNRPMGMTCDTVVAGTRNTSYTAPSSVTGPCFTSDYENISVTLSGVVIPLMQARVAATYTGGLPPTRLSPGVMSGFLTKADAMAIRFPATTPIIGGDTLYQHLADGRATGSSCSSADDSDSVTGAGDTGFWFYLNVSADVVTWTGP